MERRELALLSEQNTVWNCFVCFCAKIYIMALKLWIEFGMRPIFHSAHTQRIHYTERNNTNNVTQYYNYHNANEQTNENEFLFNDLCI